MPRAEVKKLEEGKKGRERGRECRRKGLRREERRPAGNGAWW